MAKKKNDDLVEKEVVEEAAPVAKQPEAPAYPTKEGHVTRVVREGQRFMHKVGGEFVFVENRYAKHDSTLLATVSPEEWAAKK